MTARPSDLAQTIAQRVTGVGRQKKEFRGICAILRGTPPRFRILLKRHVEIRAAEAERADRCATWMLASPYPRAGFGVQIEGGTLDAEFRVRDPDIDRRWQHLMMQRRSDFHQTGGTGGGLCMTDLRFDRAEGAPCPGPIVRVAEYFRETGNLRRITRARSGSMRLHEFNCLRTDLRRPEGAPNSARLTTRARCIDARSPAIRRGTYPIDDGIDGIPVPLRILQAT